MEAQKGPSATQLYCRGFGEFLLSLLVSNLAALIFILLGLWLFSITLLRILPMPGIDDAPAEVQDTGMDLASMRYIIFESNSWFSTPVPPPPPPPQ